MIVARLVVPGHLPKMHAKALDAGADEVVFDLEDAVALDAKAAARAVLAETLRRPEWSARPVAIRVNGAGSEQAEDLALCSSLGLEQLSIVVPKVESTDDVSAAAEVAPVQAIVETPQGLAAAAHVAEHERVIALILGYADLAAALGRRGAQDDVSRWLVAQETVLAAARIGGAAAVDGPSFALRDARAVADSARAARELGFDGKWAIHPAQIAPIQAEFAPSAGERRWAQRVKAAVGAAGGGGGAAAALDGAMVDEAMVRRADRLLALPAAPEPPAPVPATRSVAAPFFDDLERGATFTAPGVTLTEGHAALHQAIVGDRLRLALDADLYQAVSGTAGLLAHPMLVCDVAIGQSTAPSRRVLGNLFYRGLGADRSRSATRCTRRPRSSPGETASRGRGIVALRVRTLDGQGEPVLDFHRARCCPPRARGHATSRRRSRRRRRRGGRCRGTDPRRVGSRAAARRAAGIAVRRAAGGGRGAVEAGETVTAAPELARLSLNMAHTHTDAGASAHGRRLVYGGHAIGVAASQVTRALPDLASILAWEACDHLGPVFEGERLHSRVAITTCEPLADGGLVHLRVTRLHGR